MVRTMLPAIVGLVAIVSLSFYEGSAMKDRWGVPGAEAAELGERFDQVPKTIGDWQGEDLPVDEIERKTAGAVKYVSRLYTNAISGKQVRLWLIVGHSRDITQHTPNICYPSSGFRQTGQQLRHHINLENGKEAVFNTATFEKENAHGRLTDRVFWTFNHPDKNLWEAPEREGWMSGARSHYGLSRALYKMYFTSLVTPGEETIEESPAVKFAELMLPAIDSALFLADDASAGDASAGTSDAAAL